MNLLLDTTVLVDALRAREHRRVLLAELIEADHHLTISAVTLAEVYAGLRAGEEAKVALLLAQFYCFPVDREIAKRAGLLRNAESRQGRTVSLADAMIAATALEHEQTLVTDNRRHFLHTGVQLLAVSDWTS